MAQHLKLHALTGSSDHDTTGLINGQILYVQDPTNGVQSTGIYTNGSGGLTATTASITTLSAGTMISGSTNLYNIFSTAGSGVQSVGANGNLSTGGTATNPTIILAASPSFNNLTASGLSTFNTLTATSISATSLNMMNNKIINVDTPTTANDAVNKYYVDNLSFGLIWQQPVSFINAIAETASPTASTVVNDGYIINTGGNTGPWSAFSAGDLIQYQITGWTFIKSLVVGDRIGISFKSNTTPYGSFSGKNDYIAEITGGTAGAYTWAFTAPVNNYALFVNNSYAYYSNVSFTYSSSLVEWVQLDASIKYTFGDGLSVQGNVVRAVYTDGFSYNNANIISLTQNYGGPAFDVTINQMTGLTVNGGLTSTTASITTLSAGTMISGSTNLYQIFAPYGTVSGVETIGQGSNITTGGTVVNPIINVVASPSFNNITYSGTSTGGNLIATNVSATTLYSGSTNVGNLFVNDVTAGSNTTIGGSANHPIVNVATNPSFNNLTASGATSLQTVSATTMISGSTNLYQIFAPFGTVSGVESVGTTGNLTTGGTAVNPIINIVASPSFNNITFSGTATGGNVYGTNVSGGTLYSGSTNVSSLFVNGVLAGSNTTIGGSSTYPIVNVVANPSFNNLTASGATSLQTLSATTMISGSTDLYNIFTTAGSGVQSVGANGNLSTGGTATNPTIILAASPSFNNLTVSGTGNFTGTLQSGGTNLYDIFTEGVGTANVLPLWSNNTGLLTNSIITQSGTGVTVAGSVNIIGDVNVLGTATTFNTQTVQSQDNNILLNFSGSYVSALGGGITVLSGTPSGVASTWSIDANGSWSSNTAILTSAITVNGGNIAVTGGGAMTSGGTNLYNIFATAGSGVQSVGANGNLSTGGTATNPTIILAASPSFNNLTVSGATSLQTLSATTMISGSTNLYNIFATAGSGVQSVGANGNLSTGGTATNPTIILAASPSFNDLTVSGNTTTQGISGTTIYASQFFQMTPYTGANPTSPNNNDVWFYSAATGIITLNYRVGGATKSVELS